MKHWLREARNEKIFVAWKGNTDGGWESVDELMNERKRKQNERENVRMREVEIEIDTMLVFIWRLKFQYTSFI